MAKIGVEAPECSVDVEQEWEDIASLAVDDRLRALRKQNLFSQDEIEERTRLLRCYISRVENRHTVPAVETLEKFARALEVPLSQPFYDGRVRHPWLFIVDFRLHSKVHFKLIILQSLLPVPITCTKKSRMAPS